MHGLIYSELKKYYEKDQGQGAWNALLCDAGITPKVILMSADYEDNDVMDVITLISQKKGISVSQILEDFGQFIAPSLMKHYSVLIHADWKTLDLLQHAEDTIHKIVRIRDAAARPPELLCERTGANEVVITYASARRMCNLAKGIVKRIAQHYNQKISISEETCMHKGDEKCVMSVLLIS